ncbi:MAG: hypothetical protein JSR46_07575 [Verrucomicrobia bacterium]|nr:hypothetical protein [Verrucomicrobiota bacterium]
MKTFMALVSLFLMGQSLALPSEEDKVILNKTSEKISGITTLSLEKKSMKRKIRAYGSVLSAEPLVAARSRIVQAEQQLEKAKGYLFASLKEYERLQALYSDQQNISEKTLDAARAAWVADESTMLAAQASLDYEKKSLLLKVGPILLDWVISSSEGFRRLSLQEDMLIQITLPNTVFMPTPPSIALLQSASGSMIQAELISPSPKTDNRVQGMSFFYFAPYQTLKMLPEANVLALLPTNIRIVGVEIPRSSVIWWQGKAWVYLEKAKGEFVRKEIKTDLPTQSGWFIENGQGLLPGEKIVVTGAQVLLSQELLVTTRPSGEVE